MCAKPEAGGMSERKRSVRGTAAARGGGIVAVGAKVLGASANSAVLVQSRTPTVMSNKVIRRQAAICRRSIGSPGADMLNLV